MTSPINKHYIEIDSGDTSASYQSLGLLDIYTDQDQIELIRTFDLPSEDFETIDLVDLSFIDHDVWTPLPLSTPLALSKTIVDIPTHATDMFINLDLQYGFWTNALKWSIESPSGTVVEVHPGGGDIVDWEGFRVNNSYSVNATFPYEEDWAGEWTIIIENELPFDPSDLGMGDFFDNVHISTASFVIESKVLGLTTEEARTIYTLPNADSSGSSMYTIDPANKKIHFSDNAGDYIWQDGIHHSRGYDIQLPIISSDDDLVLVRKTPAMNRIQIWEKDEALRSSLMNPSISQILFLNQEYLERVQHSSLNPFITGSRNGYAPLDGDTTVPRKFFSDSIGIEQTVHFFPASGIPGNAQLHTDTQVCDMYDVPAEWDMHYHVDCCHMPCSTNGRFKVGGEWHYLDIARRRFNITAGAIEEAGQKLELRVIIEHPDVRDIQLTVFGNYDYDYEVLRNFGELNEDGGFVNLEATYELSNTWFTDLSNSPSHPEDKLLPGPLWLEIKNPVDAEWVKGTVIEAEIICSTGVDVSLPVTWMGQITGERLEEFGGIIDIIPRIPTYQFEYRNNVGKFIDKWIPSMPFGYSAADREAGELVKWRQDDGMGTPAHWETVGMKLNHLENVFAKRRVWY